LGLIGLRSQEAAGKVKAGRSLIWEQLERNLLPGNLGY
jgi:hypothetical protein